jgi:hypothetical protein
LLDVELSRPGRARAISKRRCATSRTICTGGRFFPPPRRLENRRDRGDISGSSTRTGVRSRDPHQTPRAPRFPALYVDRECHTSEGTPLQPRRARASMSFCPETRVGARSARVAVETYMVMLLRRFNVLCGLSHPFCACFRPCSADLCKSNAKPVRLIKDALARILLEFDARRRQISNHRSLLRPSPLHRIARSRTRERDADGAMWDSARDGALTGSQPIQRR